jgi:hypothetical protein
MRCDGLGDVVDHEGLLQVGGKSRPRLTSNMKRMFFSAKKPAYRRPIKLREEKPL